VTLTSGKKQEFLKRGFTRRSFGRLATMIAAGSSLPFYSESALAQLSQVKGAPADAVMINANENPLGPCAEAMEAIHKAVAKGGRYMYGEADSLAELLAEQEGLKPGYVQVFAGSSAPLHQAVLGFTSPNSPFVMGDPGYESGEKAAQFIGAKVVKVPLTKDYRHDVKAMASVDNAGLIYISNPNNPTGTLTPKEEIEWIVANKPAGAVVMIDEAYTHISGAPFHSGLVAADKDVIILRTFSKIYGMAGLRAGAAFARPDLLEKITPYSSGGMPVPAMVGAQASLKVKTLVPARRKIIQEVREDTLAFLEKHGFSYVPSVSNKFMVDVNRPGNEIVMALRKEKVYIGRVWDIWPTHVRVSVGTAEEMAKFKAAFLKVMA
jgi:histidinol-phosphate/aromatic aminotransferase/cobyric acid decarboxylase-like protein